MAKVKYYYDSDTLSYKKVKVSSSQRIKNLLVITGLVIVNFIVGFVVLSQLVKSPTERQQAREVDNMRLHYELLNKRIEESTNILADMQDRDNNVYRTYFEVSPIPSDQRKAGFGGVNRYKYLEGFDYSEMIQKATKDLDILSKQIVVQSKSLDEIVSLAKEQKKMLMSIPAIQPVKKDEARVGSGYGVRMHPVLKIRKMHQGMDFAAPKGTPIYASGSGKVIQASRSATYGNVVCINHGFGYKTVYAHMSKIVTRRRKKVKRGDLIGYVGSTGRSTGPHLHYEVHKNGKAVNPINYYYGDLSPSEFEEMQKASESCSQSFD